MSEAFFLTIDSSFNAHLHLKNHISYIQEEVWVIVLNSRKKPVRTARLFIGSATSCTIHPREIFRSVMLNNGCSYILCHSHPSGDSTPSVQDLSFTKKLKKASALMELPLDDHIIFAKNNYFSFRDSGHL